MLGFDGDASRPCPHCKPTARYPAMAYPPTCLSADRLSSFIVVYRDGMTLVAVEVGVEPLVEWVTPSLTVKRGRDPLGMQTITLDRIMPTLLPGVLALSERARYLAIYPFLLSLYEERRLAADNASLGEFIRLREYELCLAMQMCPRCSAAKAIGSERPARTSVVALRSCPAASRSRARWADMGFTIARRSSTWTL